MLSATRPVGEKTGPLPAVAVGGRVVLKCAASMFCHVTPSELARVYCVLETAKLGTTPVGKVSATRLVGEKTGPLPAAATMVTPVAGLFVFHFSLKTYAWPLVML